VPDHGAGDDVTNIQYTSGTTGSPKGVLLTHRNILKSLYVKDRSGAPCNKCDYKGGFRLGFLKDPR